MNKKHVARQDIEDQSFAVTMELQKVWKSYVQVRLHADGISWAQLMMLYTIRAGQPIASRKLGSLLHITPGAVTQLVDGLVADGYVKREENAHDRRVIDVSLTAGGTARLQKLDHTRRENFVELLSVLSDSELKQYTEYQQKILQQIETLYRDNNPEGAK